MTKEEFIKEEVRDGFLVTTKRKKLWWCLLELLQEVDRVCKKYNLQYFVDSGTLLGAVRHGGFIPWDDDLDIVMPRKDYDKLMKLSNEFSNPFFLQSAYTEKRYYRFHAQLRNSETTGILKSELGKAFFNQGIFLDIFPLDGLPSDRKERYYHKLRLKIYLSEMAFFMKYRKKSWKSNLMDSFSSHFYPFRKRYRKMENLASKYSWDDPKVKLVEAVTFCCDKKFHKIEKKCYSSVEYMQFEFLMVPAPVGWDGVLRGLFGSKYMTPIQEPPLHGGMIVDTECSYRNYIAKYYNKGTKNDKSNNIWNI